MWKRKKLTIPCDKCGARLENIPEKCPHCGEIIRSKLNPSIYESIKEILCSGEINRRLLTVVYLAITLIYCFLIWLTYKGFEPRGIYTVPNIIFASFALGALFVAIFDKKSWFKGYAFHLTQIMGLLVLTPHIFVYGTFWGGCITERVIGFSILAGVFPFVLGGALIFLVSLFFAAIMIFRKPISIGWVLLYLYELAGLSYIFYRVFIQLGNEALPNA
jgi:hypothetical protein